MKILKSEKMIEKVSVEYRIQTGLHQQKGEVNIIISERNSIV